MEGPGELDWATWWSNGVGVWADPGALLGSFEMGVTETPASAAGLPGFTTVLDEDGKVEGTVDISPSAVACPVDS